MTTHPQSDGETPRTDAVFKRYDSGLALSGDIHVEMELLERDNAALRELVRRKDADYDKADTRCLDTANKIGFYERDFYVLSNFSAFTILWNGIRFDTSEAVYHWEKFQNNPRVQWMIEKAPSAHEAFKIAERERGVRRSDWDLTKVDIMRCIIREKARQHEYVRRKLLATGNRLLVEDSWRDDFWGWGPARDGQNMLGKLWMEIRAELLALSPDESKREGK